MHHRGELLPFLRTHVATSSGQKVGRTEPAVELQAHRALTFGFESRPFHFDLGIEFRLRSAEAKRRQTDACGVHIDTSAQMGHGELPQPFFKSQLRDAHLQASRAVVTETVDAHIEPAEVEQGRLGQRSACHVHEDRPLAHRESVHGIMGLAQVEMSVLQLGIGQRGSQVHRIAGQGEA